MGKNGSFKEALNTIINQIKSEFINLFNLINRHKELTEKNERLIKENNNLLRWLVKDRGGNPNSISRRTYNNNNDDDDNEQEEKP